MSTENYRLELYPENRDMSKKWFVELNFTDPRTLETCRKQYRGKINSHKNKTDRLKEAKDLKEALEAELEEGWNPITGQVDNPNDITDDRSQMPFNEAIDFSFKRKKSDLSPKSVRDIGGVCEFAKSAAIKCRIHLMPIGQTKRRHIKELLNQIGKDRQAIYDKAKPGERYYKKQFTGNAYNKYKSFLQIIFKELLEYDAVEYNPCEKLSNRVEISTNIHRHATKKEEDIIKAHLRSEHPNFYTYLAFEYLTGIRPKELFGMQICDIDWLNQCIDLHPVEGKTKTKKERKVPIPNTLLPYIERLHLERYDPHDYIFSTNFLPGPERMKHMADYATKYWKKVVKDGLGINVSLYSFKGKGGEAKRVAGIDMGSVSAGYGHGTINMTKVYLHGEQDRINKELIEKTPGF